MPKAKRVRVRQGVRFYRQPDGFPLPIGERIRDPITDASGYFCGCWFNPFVKRWFCELRNWKEPATAAETIYMNVELPQVREILDRLTTHGGPPRLRVIDGGRDEHTP